MKRLALAAALLSLAAPALGQAPSPYGQPPPPPGAPPPAPPGYYVPGPHEGFYLSFSLGLSGLKSRYDSPALGNLEMTGTGLSLGFGLGGSVAPGVILAGHMFVLSAPSPKVSDSLGSAQLGSDTSFGLVGLGPSLIFYAMPSNVFFQVTPAFTRLTADFGGGNTGSTDGGLGVYLGIGKEWWVGPRWGMGLSAFGVFASNRDLDGTWKSSGFGLAFSATLN